MPTELNLRFPDPDHVIVRLGPEDDGSGHLSFGNPITGKDLQDIQWYVETYGAHSLGDPDDREAARIASQLSVWGSRLFQAVFHDDTAKSRFFQFWQVEDEARLLTVSAEHPTILSLPWELLHDANSGGGYLFMANPRISIRRRVAGATGISAPFKPAAKDALHLLFVISRPDDAGFLDPRADAQPVLEAIEKQAPGRVSYEFLRPATLKALLERLEDSDKPAVDVLHFDGHGVFDREGGLPKRVALARRIARMEEVVRENGAAPWPDADCPPNTGYLLFESPEGHSDFVSAEKLGANLNRHKVALAILSACQSAAVGDAKENGKSERPMGSVAARLTATGIPSVLAMTHSVLIHTTRALFGEFYKELAGQKGIGVSLDNARRHLANNPEKYQVQRGPDRVPLKLYDWFLPALYQQGTDGPLLKASGEKGKGEAGPAIRSNLAKAPEVGFFGRKRKLWEIERWFAGSTRRITIAGFGGQGKTALALEAGRWLTRTGLFQAAVFVNYSHVQAKDAVAVAVSNISSVLGESLIDAASASRLLQRTPTLVILDNLEALAPESLQALLSAAVAWSEAGGSRVLCTTRRPDFGHADYKIEGTNFHRRIQLDGLGSKRSPDDALEWCAALMKLPPAPSVPTPNRGELIGLFDRVNFHPLSIRVLAQQLKIRSAAELGARLGELLAGAAAGREGEDTPAGLLASLELSLDKLDAAARQVLPRLGVFRGGACEDGLLAITGLGDAGTPAAWPGLRRQLEAVALIEAEDIPGVGVPYLRFHPTLAPMLWPRLDVAEQARLNLAHRQRYYALSRYLYQEDSRHPHQARAIAWRELPNVLHAVHAALDAGDPDAVDFAVYVNRFLGSFGLKQEAESLVAKAQAAAGEAGSRAWYLAQSNRGEQLLGSGQVAEAAQVFQAILKQLGDTPNYERALTLHRLGRCCGAAGQPRQAEQLHGEALAVLDRLEPSDGVKRERGVVLTCLADVLAEQGRFGEARKAYQDGLKAKKEIGDERGQGVTFGQLGTLAMLEGNLPEAADRFRDALAHFQQLREPASEAVAWHQLGRVFQESQQWEQAERHYRESARIEEERGNLLGAAQTCNQLAAVNEAAGKPDAGEMWYRKAIEGFRAVGDETSPAAVLSNLAGLLRTQPGRLAEARQLAEEALAIGQTLDPGAAEIWKTYTILADIADQEAQAAPDARQTADLQAQGREYRRLAREAKRNFAGTRHELRQRLPVILRTITSVHDPKQRLQFEQMLPGMEQHGWTNLVAAIRRILAGERDPDALCAALDLEDSMIVETVLQGLADPSILSDLFPSDPAPG
ncbi:MAG TPA: tetratricopeptide repeat protein [Polyangia bacterium]|nr:tetratricopeptide repeat protein [Polyangia bacterium]